MNQAPISRLLSLDEVGPGFAPDVRCINVRAGTVSSKPNTSWVTFSYNNRVGRKFNCQEFIPTTYEVPMEYTETFISWVKQTYAVQGQTQLRPLSYAATLRAVGPEKIVDRRLRREIPPGGSIHLDDVKPGSCPSHYISRRDNPDKFGWVTISVDIIGLPTMTVGCTREHAHRVMEHISKVLSDDPTVTTHNTIRGYLSRLGYTQVNPRRIKRR